MAKNLIIFIDSFPYKFLCKTKYLANGFPTKCKLTPGFGFSVNIYAELFSGCIPDEIGYFCEWTLKDKKEKSNFIHPLYRIYTSGLSKIFDLSIHIPLFSVLMHKVIGRIIGFRIANIPFKYLDMFAEDSKSVYSEDFPKPTIFSASEDLKVVLAESYGRKVGNRDYLAFTEAKRYTESGESVFISLIDLDNIAHIYGVESIEYNQKIKELDAWVEDLSKEFYQIHGKNGVITVLSDHGMANVNKGVSINLESRVGKVGRDSYAYFLDSVILRVWFFNHKIRVKIQDYLQRLEFGCLLDENDRRNYGVTSPKWGDLIFVLDEGYFFQPNFHGWRLSKAMHGYLPTLESQKGIFLCSKNYLIPSQNVSTLDVYKALKENIT